MPTPGVHFLLAAVPKLLLPPLLAHALLSLLADHLPFSLPRTRIVAVWVFSLPVLASFKALYSHLHNIREARRLGAELVPQFKGTLPGNVDLLWTHLFNKNWHLGDAFGIPMQSLGSTISITIFGDLRVITAHPENIKQILATEFDSFEKGEGFNKFSGSVLGTGVFNSDGEMWQFHRKLTRPFFARERVTDFGIFDEKTRIALDKMEQRLASGDPIDFQDICSRFTIDSACEFLLGASIHSLNDPLPLPSQKDNSVFLNTPSNRFARAFADAQDSISVRSRLVPFWPLFEIFRDRTGADMRVVRGFIEPIVRAAIDRRNAAGGKKPVMEKDSLLQHLLNVTDDMKVIIDETVNIMLAGRDTTAGLITFVTYCLAMHPEVLKRLREEIIAVVGTSRAPTFDDVRDMKYLRAVINETLRLFPSVPFNSRFTINSTVLTGDDGRKFFVPAKTRVLYSVFLMQRDPAYWGPDAHIFDPNRWLDDRVQKYLIPNPFIFLPFNAGPRICLGQQFAYHETSFFIIRLLQRFDRITLAPEAVPAAARPPCSWAESTEGTPRKRIERFVMRSHLTAYAEGGMWMRMQRAKVAEGV